MAWNDAPPTSAELSNTPSPKSDWTSTPPSSDEQGLMDKLSEKYHGNINEAIGDIPVIGKPLRAFKEGREDLNSSALRSLLGGLGGKAEAAGRAGIEKISGSDQDLSDLYTKYKAMVAQKQQEAEARSPLASGAGKILGTTAPAMAT